MIVNFYKVYNCNKVHNSHNSKALLASKNIEHVPQKGTLIRFSGQSFVVENISFDIDKCIYNIYVTRL